MKTFENKDKFSYIYFFIGAFLIITICILLVITYNSLYNPKNFNETYEEKVLDNTINPDAFFTEYNAQLSNYNLSTVQDYEIQYQKNDSSSYHSSESPNMPINTYHAYANWKPETEWYPNTNGLFMTINVFPKAIVYKNFIQNAASDDYNIAILKTMRNILIKTGYSCIPEEDLLDKYATIKNKTLRTGDIDTIDISQDFILSISFSDFDITFKILYDNKV